MWKTIWFRGRKEIVPVRVIREHAREASVPLLIYFHGGGFVFGRSGNTRPPAAAPWPRNPGAVVIAVNYRLAHPRIPPAAVEDSHAVTKWVETNAGRLGIDARRICRGRR